MKRFKVWRRLVSGAEAKMFAAAVVLGWLACAWPVQAGESARTPELPLPLCEQIEAPEGHLVKFRAYAEGVQIYVWTGTGWAFRGPEAVLYAAPNFRGEIGIHYAGPRWEAKDGSIVQGSQAVPCFPDGGSIPWLRLKGTPLTGHGLFADITYIQRVNTTGGLVPNYAGTTVGEEARVPYTAEYYFYRAE